MPAVINWIAGTCTCKSYLVSLLLGEPFTVASLQQCHIQRNSNCSCKSISTRRKRRIRTHGCPCTWNMSLAPFMYLRRLKNGNLGLFYGEFSFLQVSKFRDLRLSLIVGTDWPLLLVSSVSFKYTSIGFKL